MSESTIYAAIELSRAGWLVGVQSTTDRRPARHRLPAGASARLIALLEAQRRAAARQAGQPVRVCSCYEAGYEGFWLHRVLLANGIDSHIVDPSSLQINRRARRAKTDAIDVETILRALIAWDRGERGLCAMVVAPDPAREDERRCSRERERLVKERTAHRNRIGGLLMTVGVYEARLSAATWPAQRATLVTGDGRKLPPLLAAEIGRELDRLALLDRQLAAIEPRRLPPRPRGRPPADGHPAPEPSTPLGRIARLARLRAIGPEIASVLQHEVFWRHFANRRQIASYVGLDPSPFASGAMCREQGISKAGNRRARRVLVELAWLWLRWQPASALARWYQERVGAAQGRARRTLIVALARKLLIALWRYLETGKVPDGAVLRA